MQRFLKNHVAYARPGFGKTSTSPSRVGLCRQSKARLVRHTGEGLGKRGIAYQNRTIAFASLYAQRRAWMISHDATLIFLPSSVVGEWLRLPLYQGLFNLFIPTGAAIFSLSCFFLKLCLFRLKYIISRRRRRRRRRRRAPAKFQQTCSIYVANTTRRVLSLPLLIPCVSESVPPWSSTSGRLRGTKRCLLKTMTASLFSWFFFAWVDWLVWKAFRAGKLKSADLFPIHQDLAFEKVNANLLCTKTKTLSSSSTSSS